MSGGPTLEQVISPCHGIALRAGGTWTAHHASDLEQMVGKAEQMADGRRGVLIDVTRVSQLDTFGAWFIERMRRSYAEAGAEPKIWGCRRPIPAADRRGQQGSEARAGCPIPLHRRFAPCSSRSAARWWVSSGHPRDAVRADGDDRRHRLRCLPPYQVVRHPSHFRFTSLVHHLEYVAWRAVPIILIVTFLVGSIISQQGIFHFS